ncbi:MAG: NUDIX hydrolase [Myxococcota bacterium]
MARRPIPTWCFALVVVRLGHRFLVVQETKHDQLWYLPAGRVEAGESFAQTAHRETLEEAGISIVLEGIVRVEHTPSPDGHARMRVVFVARPADDTPPKSVADEESIQARWVTLEELDELPLRGLEFRRLFQHVADGAPIYPMRALTFEGAPYT